MILAIVYRKTKTGREAHRITEREFISYAGDADTFKEHLYAVALKHGLEHAKKVVIISDGAKWIKGFREKFCANLDVVHILDYSHVKENIYKFANVFIRGAKQKTAWAEELARLVKEGKIDEAIAKAEPYNALGFRTFTATSATIGTASTIRLTLLPGTLSVVA